MSDDLLAVGFVLDAHGLRGQLKVRLWNRDSTLLEGCSTLHLQHEAPAAPCSWTLSQAQRQGNDWLVKLDGIDQREAAEAWRSAQVSVPRTQLPELPENEYYHVDLLGLGVEDESGNSLGCVVEVLNYPSVDCLAVESDDGECWELPMIDPYLRGIDVTNRRVLAARIAELPRRRKKR